VIESFGSLSEVLVWIATAGGAMWLFGLIEARLLENWVFWHSLKPWIKKIVPIVIAGGLSVVAQSVITVDILQFVPESVSVILLAAINYYFSQREYQTIKDSGYGVSARLEAAG